MGQVELPAAALSFFSLLATALRLVSSHRADAVPIAGFSSARFMRLLVGGEFTGRSPPDPEDRGTQRAELECRGEHRTHHQCGETKHSMSAELQAGVTSGQCVRSPVRPERRDREEQTTSPTPQAGRCDAMTSGRSRC
jgi:hypothetical protein